MPNPVAFVLKSRIAQTVGNRIRGLVLPGSRCDGPQFARILIPNKAQLSGGIQHRIVAPRGQFALPAVPPEGISGAELRDKGAEAWIGEDVNPWRRQMFAVLD